MNHNKPIVVSAVGLANTNPSTVFSPRAQTRLHRWLAGTFAGVGVLGVALTISCGPSTKTGVTATSQTGQTQTSGGNAPVNVRSFSDSRPVKTLASAAGLVWVGTSRGLIRWSTTTEPPTPAVLTTIDGLPSDRIEGIALDFRGGVWVTTPKGVARLASGAWTKFPKAPVGDLAAGIIITPEGENVWMGGSDGLARLKDGQWERYAAGMIVTALAHDGASGVWVGTSGKGLVRIVKNEMLQFGISEGNDIDNVRALVADSGGSLLAVGDGAGGQRVAFFDGTRFWSYKVDNTHVIEWVQRVGTDLYLGAGQNVWTMKRVASAGEARGPLKFTFSGSPSLGAPKAQPLASLLVKEAAPPPPAAAPAGPAPEPPKTNGGPGAPGPKENKGGKGGKGAKDKTAPKKTGALLSPKADEYAVALPVPAARHAVRPWLVAGPGGSVGSAPIFDTEAQDMRLPDGITAVASDTDALYVGTRFLGVSKFQRNRHTPLRLYDLTAAAERLSVACINNNDCYVATGGVQAWRFDGQTFEVTNVDPEKGSHVLAVVRDPTGAVIALHRGASSREVRISRVGKQGDWSPVGLTPLEVPSGVPDLSFASYSPKGQLWVGLRYLDKEQEARAYGAAEVYVDDSRVVYHRQRPAGSQPGVSQGVNVPSDVSAIIWKGSSEAWLASGAGAVRLVDNKTVKVFTENDGLESELIHDVVEGFSSQIWVGTSRGIGVWDGTRWSFPKNPPFNSKTSALARDPDGRIWVGTDRGLIEMLNEKRYHQISTRSGLLDDKVLNMGVDVRGRIWVLTEKGISVVEPLQVN